MTNKTPGKRKWTEKEVRQWYQDTGAFTYANPDDWNVVVKKPRSEGWTVNWANPRAYLQMLIDKDYDFIIEDDIEE